jgi:hypothetical protein
VHGTQDNVHTELAAMCVTLKVMYTLILLSCAFTQGKVRADLAVMSMVIKIMNTQILLSCA